MTDSNVSIFALGGLGEIGKNMYVIEYNDQIIIIDSGLKFPEDEMLGIDIVIPDTTYLLENRKKIKAVFLTHGHEDHIGALPYLLRQFDIPIYGASLTLGLVRAKLEENDLLGRAQLNQVDGDSVVKIGDMKVSFFRTTHSIPDSMGVVVHTPEGAIVHTGDFKFDMTPVGKPPGFSKMAELGEKGVLALLSDSTNSEKPGYTLSERVVGETIQGIFNQSEGRVILATFASNVYRLQQVVEAAVQYNRKVAVVGRSMEKVFQIGQELGYIRIPKGVLVDLKEVDRLPANRVVIISTGSQGEPMAALTRMARGSHRMLQIVPGDTVILSASPIPGNTLSVSRTIDQLFQAGANVHYGSILDLHASGHGAQEELKLMLNLLNPKYFVPIHGEYRMLKQHVKLAHQVGIPEKNCFIIDIGERLEVNRKHAARAGKVPSGYTLIDGKGIGDIGNIVLRDRKILSQDGLIVIVVSINKKAVKIASGPDLISRGFVYVRESEDLLKEATVLVKKEIEHLLSRNVTQWSEMKTSITNTLNPFLFEKTRRKPMILPVIMEV